MVGVGGFELPTSCSQSRRAYFYIILYTNNKFSRAVNFLLNFCTATTRASAEVLLKIHGISAYKYYNRTSCKIAEPNCFSRDSLSRR